MQMHVRHWPIIREASAGLRRDERKTGTIRLPVDDTSYFNRARDLRRGGRRGAVGDGENKTISGKMVGGRKEKKREGEREGGMHRNESRSQGQAERGGAGQCTLHSCPRSRRCVLSASGGDP